METTIKKKFTIDQIEELFESDLINIKFFQIQEEISYSDPNQKFNYKVSIRHSEDKPVYNIIEEALKHINILIKAKKYLSYKELKLPKSSEGIIKLAYEIEQKERFSSNNHFMNYINNR